MVNIVKKVKQYLYVMYLGGDTRVALIDDKIKINANNNSEDMIMDALED